MPLLVLTFTKPNMSFYKLLINILSDSTEYYSVIYEKKGVVKEIALNPPLKIAPFWTLTSSFFKLLINSVFEAWM